ncbi:KAP family NTPase [bacterium]|nr:KAP family NTPase [bacterium]
MIQQTHPITTSYLNDHWTLDVELLGYKNMADRLVDVISTSSPPFALAVCGGWGTGKTSILKYLMAKTGGHLLRMDPENVLIPMEADENLEELPSDMKAHWVNLSSSKKIPSVWFNPWQHQFEKNCLQALLHEMYNQFSVRLKIVGEAKKVGTVLFKTGLKLLKDLTKVDLTVIETTGKQYEKDQYHTALDSQRFPLFFEQAVRHLAAGSIGNKTLSGQERLVIFVDDLDRCQPDIAYKLLESIKLYLNTPYCVFVFGIDYERLTHQFAELHDFSSSLNNASDYLDKMFQSVVKLQLPTEDMFTNFIEHQFSIVNIDILTTEHAHTLSQILERNPRKVKNFINSLKVQLALKPDRTSEDDKYVIKMILIHYLRQFYPGAYAALEIQPSAFKSLYSTLDKSPDPENPSDPFFRFFGELFRNEFVNTHPDRSVEEGKIVGGLLNMAENVDRLRFENMKKLYRVFQARKNFSELFVTTFQNDEGKFHDENFSCYF